MEKMTGIILICMLGVVAGCQSEQAAPAPQAAPTPQTAAPAPRPPQIVLEATRVTPDNFQQAAAAKWTLQSMTLDGETLDVPEPQPTLLLEPDQTLSGQAFINRYFGSFRIGDNGRIRWPAPIGATRMAGNFNLLRREIQYLKALPLTEWMAVRDSRLILTSSDAQTRLLYAPAQNR
jgi:heat shock protein HslJ